MTEVRRVVDPAGEPVTDLPPGDYEVTRTDDPATVKIIPRMTGHCACCGAPTRKLFAMGHDARYRGLLQRALAAGGNWNTVVQWHATADGIGVPVTVRGAIVAIRILVDADWYQRVADGASRIAKKPVSAPALDDPADEAEAAVDEDAFDPQLSSDRAVEDLIDRINAVPHVGEWGWFVDGNGKRFPARVQRTRRDKGDETVDFLVHEVPGQQRLLEHQSAGSWHRDEAAQGSA